MLIVSIDSGRGQTKVCASNGKKVCFPSVVGEFRETPLLDGKDKPKYEMVINDEERYFVGELAEQESKFFRRMGTSSKIHSETRALQIAAAAIVAQPGSSIRMVTGVPIDQYNKETKEELADMLQGNYNVTISGRQKNFTINNISIAPEGCAAYWDVVLNDKGRPIESPYRKGLVRLLDVGSRTVNFGTVNDGKFVNRSSVTLPFGYGELANNKSLTPTENDKGNFVRKVLADLSWINIEPEKEAIILTGGGAIALETQFKAVFPLARLISDPVFGNARGYLKLGMVQWQEN